MKKIYFFLLCMVYALCTAGEPVVKKVSLTGTVTDAIDGSQLIGVSIYVPSLSEGATTNEKGTYLLEDLPDKKITLQVSYLGHQTIIKGGGPQSDARAELRDAGEQRLAQRSRRDRTHGAVAHEGLADTRLRGHQPAVADFLVE
jgi:hypothetical protein